MEPSHCRHTDAFLLESVSAALLAREESAITTSTLMRTLAAEIVTMTSLTLALSLAMKADLIESI